jgi:hypothetical protein
MCHKRLRAGIRGGDTKEPIAIEHGMLYLVMAHWAFAVATGYVPHHIIEHPTSVAV